MSSDANWQVVLRMAEAQDWAGIVAFIAALEEANTDVRFCWQLGWAHYKLGNVAAARHQFEHATATWPGHANSHFALGVVLAEADDFSRAELHLLRAIALRESLRARLALALVYMQQGRTQEAERVHREGIRLVPNDRERLEALADFLDDCGRADEARDVREQAEAPPSSGSQREDE